jgi:methyl-accepting chemotaxis protein
MTGEEESKESLKNRAKEAVDFDFVKAIDNAMEGARKLNAAFGQTRERMTEMMQAVSNSVPGITALGGKITDVFETLEGVSLATKRNVIASEDQVRSLYAVSKVMGDSVQNIVSEFTDVGVQFAQVGEQVQTSVNYIRSVGLNAKDIMGDVSRQMDNLNKFNFAGGVEGLTKMAAQAATFRFNMSETFALAEKALSPDGAIELASAFQRMGVASGDLVDPFQLMNKSLNDPEGLQKSLIDMTKQYTEFDEKTKTFKINPAGMLQLRELSNQTGLSYENLSKSALAAANMDKAFKQLSPNLKFDNEEDRMLLGNISKMGKGGEYEVNIKEDGKDKTVKLAELNNDQLKELLKQQKEAPKSLEDVAKSQLSATESMLADVTAIKDKIVYGFTGADQIRNLTANVSNFARDATSIINKAVPGSSEISTGVTGVISQVQKLFSEIGPNMDPDKMKASITEIEKTFDKLESGASGRVKDALLEIEQKFEKTFNVDLLSKIGKISPEMSKQIEALKAGKENIEKTSASYKYDMSGTVNVKVDAVPGVSTQQLQAYVDSQDFKQKIYNMLLNMDPNTKAKWINNK